MSENLRLWKECNMRIRRAIGAASLAVLFLTGAWVISPNPDTPAPAPVDEVSVFNDGFTESKQDDCDQGFQPACDWLTNNR